MARRGIIFQLLCILQAQMTSNKTSMLMFKNFTKGLLLLIAISSYSVSNGQDVFRIAAKNVVHIENDDLSKEVPIILNSVFNVGPNKIPWFAEFENPQQWTPEEFIAWYNKKFGLSTSWKLLRETKDDLGFVHKRYQQYQVNNGMQELIVNNGTLNLHYKNNLLESFNGEIYDAQVDFIPLMNPDFKSVLSSRNQTIQEGSEPTLCYARDDSKGLGFVAPCWKLVLENKENNTLDVVFVSAIEFNKIVREEPQHIHADVTATASTYYIGTRKMITDSISSTKYRLRENIRPISTYNGAVGVDFFNSSKTWNSSTEKIATDVHFSTGLMHDFFKNKLGWDSYANHGDTIASIINLNSGGNAFWSLANNTATFLAKQNGSINPCASIDVVGHEFGHGTADEAAGLVYTGESCMLHESFADIQGTLLEWYLDSTKYNWLLGELVFSGGIRNMQDPKSMNHPDTYGGQFFPNGCHGSGEVQNYWFYLMVKGDTGTNDNAVKYSMAGLGFEKSIAIMYRSMGTYFTPNSTFENAASYALKAAKDLYGSCSPEVMYVWEAWQAVGIEDTTVNLIDLDHGIVGSTRRCTSAPDTIVLSSKGDVNREVTWYLPDGSTSNQLSTKMGMAATGSYTTILKTDICTNTFYDTLVTTLHLVPSPSFTLNKTAYCYGENDTVKLTNTTVNADPNFNLKYDWFVSPTGDQFTTKDISIPIDHEFDLSFKLTASYANGCSNSVSKTAPVKKAVVPSFTVNDACENVSVRLVNKTDTTEPQIFTWTLNAGQSFTGFQPKIVLSSAGKYTLNLSSVHAVTGCKSEANGGFEIFINPTPSFAVNNACQQGEMQLINTTQHTQKANYFRWDLQSSKPFNIDTVYRSLLNETEVIIGLEFKDDKGCFGRVYDTISIPDLNTAISGVSVACSGSENKFSTTSNNASWLYDWKYKSETGVNSTFRPSLNATGSDTVFLMISADVCSVNKFKVVNVLTAPTASFVFDGTCSEDTFKMMSTSSSIDPNSTYNWSFGNGNTSKKENPEVVFTSSETEAYQVLFRVENDNGCADSIVKTMVVNALPYCGFTYNRTGVSTVKFVADSAAYTTYLWTMPDGSTGTSNSITYNDQTGSSFEVQLQVTDNLGCSCSSSEAVLLSLDVAEAQDLGFGIFPNPNSGYFFISSSNGAEALNCSIYNASGQLVLNRTLIAEGDPFKMVHNLPPGLYVLQIASTNNSGFVKFVVY